MQVHVGDMTTEEVKSWLDDLGDRYPELSVTTLLGYLATKRRPVSGKKLQERGFGSEVQASLAAGLIEDSEQVYQGHAYTAYSLVTEATTDSARERADILTYLDVDPGATIYWISKHTLISQPRVRHHLTELAKKGKVQSCIREYTSKKGTRNVLGWTII